jgi:UDP-N-acetylmuramyl pentapeptide phosphotransferase/UDP-N-acetylglucosamine-1-phosphate transferase
MISFIIFALATVLSLALGAVAHRNASAMGTVVLPQPDRWHDRATPTMGGVAIVVATFLAFAVAITQIQVLGTVIIWGSVLSAAFAMFFV